MGSRILTTFGFMYGQQHLSTSRKGIISLMIIFVSLLTTYCLSYSHRFALPMQSFLLIS